MKKIFFFELLISVFLLFSCGGGPGTRQQDATGSMGEPEAGLFSLSADEEAFMQNLMKLCGKSFRGSETYMAPDRDSWADRDFVMHVTVCEDDSVLIPFHLDEDRSRTWMFLVEDGRLRFRHDHRHEDGTPEELTLYGGYANGAGNAFEQYFPADQYTIDLLADTLSRQWNIVMDELMTNFSYQLEYKGEIVFQADFDLSKPL